MVAAALVGIGHEVLVAADASEAMRLTDRVHLGLIILDLNLAGENGLTRMIYLRHNQPGVPVILHTGREHDEAAVVAMRQAGANQNLRKGPMEELVEAVRGSPPPTARTPRGFTKSGVTPEAERRRDEVHEAHDFKISRKSGTRVTHPSENEVSPG